MNYFRFKIPTNADGSRVTYSPGWCGTRGKCARNEKGILYNDEEGWGIAQFEGDYVPDDVTVLTEKEVTELLATAEATHKDNPKVFFGDKLVHRYDVKEDVLAAAQPARVSVPSTVKWTTMGWCNECNRSYRWQVPVPAGLKCKDVAVTVICPQGHKCVVHIDSIPQVCIMSEPIPDIGKESNLDKVRQLAEELYFNEVGQITPNGEGLFDNFIDRPNVTDEMRHQNHRLWLYRARELLKLARSDSVLSEKINQFLSFKGDWQGVGFELYRQSKAAEPEITPAMTSDIKCCSEVSDGR